VGTSAGRSRGLAVTRVESRARLFRGARSAPPTHDSLRRSLRARSDGSFQLPSGSGDAYRPSPRRGLSMSRRIREPRSIAWPRSDSCGEPRSSTQGCKCASCQARSLCRSPRALRRVSQLPFRKGRRRIGHLCAAGSSGFSAFTSRQTSRRISRGYPRVVVFAIETLRISLLNPENSGTECARGG
jgi:hypothetical protein